MSEGMEGLEASCPARPHEALSSVARRWLTGAFSGSREPCVILTEAEGRRKDLGGGSLAANLSPLPDPSTRGAGAPLAQDDS